MGCHLSQLSERMKRCSFSRSGQEEFTRTGHPALNRKSRATVSEQPNCSCDAVRKGNIFNLLLALSSTEPQKLIANVFLGSCSVGNIRKRYGILSSVRKSLNGATVFVVIRPSFRRAVCHIPMWATRVSTPEVKEFLSIYDDNAEIVAPIFRDVHRHEHWLSFRQRNRKYDPRFSP